jgi:malate synthase
MALLHYCANWVGGLGCVPVANLMEDAATAEISRSQLWHWVRHGASTVEGKKITVEYVDGILAQETEKTKKSGLDAKRVDLCARYLKEQIRAERLSDFLTSDLTCVLFLSLLFRPHDTDALAVTVDSPHLDEYTAAARTAKL